MRKLTKKSQFAVPTLPEIKRALQHWIVDHRDEMESATGLPGSNQEVISAMMLRWLELPEEVAWAELQASLVRLRERMDQDLHPIVRAGDPPPRGRPDAIRARALPHQQPDGANQERPVRSRKAKR